MAFRFACPFRDNCPCTPGIQLGGPRFAARPHGRLSVSTYSRRLCNVPRLFCMSIWEFPNLSFIYIQTGCGEVTLGSSPSRNSEIDSRISFYRSTPHSTAFQTPWLPLRSWPRSRCSFSACADRPSRDAAMPDDVYDFPTADVSATSGDYSARFVHARVQINQNA